MQAELIPDTKSGTPGADAVKVKGVITWVAAARRRAAEVRLYDRLFSVPQPGTGDKDSSRNSIPTAEGGHGYVEPSLAQAQPDDRFQFERHGYFVADRVDHGEGQPVFNRVAGMKDSWGK